ncbi:hypothetical protein HPB47_012965 [Ixodes persulcatus]|uniref:Uncharacterized protein n=1 Tax=Ixodes persulcatus TaxID=34615 RepID=A0AC60NS26_IXOPE|nr:hypothetical protein HPB47_012965 [Ixodes persulcatus]
MARSIVLTGPSAEAPDSVGRRAPERREAPTTTIPLRRPKTREPSHARARGATGPQTEAQNEKRERGSDRPSARIFQGMNRFEDELSLPTRESSQDCVEAREEDTAVRFQRCAGLLVRPTSLLLTPRFLEQGAPAFSLTPGSEQHVRSRLRVRACGVGGAPGDCISEGRRSPPTSKK